MIRPMSDAFTLDRDDVGSILIATTPNKPGPPINIKRDWKHGIGRCESQQAQRCASPHRSPTSAFSLRSVEVDVEAEGSVRALRAA